MAIYHFQFKTISRSAGRSAVACSAYRSGEKLIDEKDKEKNKTTQEKQALNLQNLCPKYKS